MLNINHSYGAVCPCGVDVYTKLILLMVASRGEGVWKSVID